MAKDKICLINYLKWPFIAIFCTGVYLREEDEISFLEKKSFDTLWVFLLNYILVAYFSQTWFTITTIGPEYNETFIVAQPE